MVHSKEGLRKAKWNPKKRHFARCIQNKNMHWKTQNASKGTQRHHLGFRVWKGVRASQPEGPERNLVKISSHTREITLTANFRSEAQSLFSVFFFTEKVFTADERRGVHCTISRYYPGWTCTPPLFPAQQKRTQTGPREQHSPSVYLRERKTFRWGVTRLMFGWSSRVSSPAFCFSFIWITSKSLG